MEYVRITSIEDPLFGKMHQLMQNVFPAEEVLEYDLWKEPIADPGIRVFAAVHAGEVVGVTEYRYYDDLNVAMTDFTIIGQHGLSIGQFISKMRLADLNEVAAASGRNIQGMFAEIYDPYRVADHGFGKIKTMDPFVRREVLSHQGYKRLDLNYVHPSWQNDGEPVFGLDLCFLPFDDSQQSISADLVVTFLTRYYTVLPNKPKEWLDMIEALKGRSTVALLGL